MAKYENLLAPGKIGTLEVRNRIFLAPMGTNLADDNGFAGERSMQFYESRAAGGAGLLLLGSVSVGYPVGSSNRWQFGLSDDKFIPKLKQLTDRVHKHGAKVAAQCSHQGRVAVNDIKDGRPQLIPSDVEPKSDPDMLADLMLEEMMDLGAAMGGKQASFKIADQEDIDHVIELFAGAARRAKAAGFDAMEIHAGHGYLIHAFLNPSLNTRTDQYGGSLENRARLLMQVIAATKQAAGKEFPIWVRMEGIEHLNPDGISHEQALETSKMVAKAGADAIHVTAYGGAANAIGPTEGYLPHKPMAIVPYARKIKEVSGLPVISMGRIAPKEADGLINNGAIDFVTMGRKLLADPELPNKLIQNRENDIRPCVYCYTCVSQIFFQRRLKCAVNTECGEEFVTVVNPTKEVRNILVIGGGLAGMEAARVASLRGHNVTLVESSKRLGGSALFSAVSYPPNGELVDYLKLQIKNLKVSVRTSTHLDLKSITDLAPDAVIVAIGGENWRPDLPGVNHDHVLDGEDFRAMVLGEKGSVTKKLGLFQRMAVGLSSRSGMSNKPSLLAKASKLYLPLGKNIVFIGGGLVAVELAEFLAERGRKVTILEEREACGKGLALVRKWRNMHDIRKLGVNVHVKVQNINITEDTVEFIDAEGQKQSALSNHVILANSPRENYGLADSLSAEGITVFRAGDCTGMGYIEGAMHEGYAAGNAC
ncbi:MAG: FAD-dependent oxidoreductase [Pseudomonadales bacterium]